MAVDGEGVQVTANGSIGSTPARADRTSPPPEGTSESPGDCHSATAGPQRVGAPSAVEKSTAAFVSAACADVPERATAPNSAAGSAGANTSHTPRNTSETCTRDPTATARSPRSPRPPGRSAQARSPSATRSTYVGSIDASHFPHLASARPYEHRSIFRTTRRFGQGPAAQAPPGQEPRRHTARRNGGHHQRRRLRSPAGHRRTPKSPGPEQERETEAAREQDAEAARMKRHPTGARTPQNIPLHHPRPGRPTAPTAPVRTTAPTGRQPRLPPSTSCGCRACPATTRPSHPHPSPSPPPPPPHPMGQSKNDRRCTCPRCAPGCRRS